MSRVRRRLDRHRPLQMALPSPYRVLCFPEKMTRINHPIFWRPPTWQLQAFPDHPVWQTHSLHSQSPRPPHTRPWLKTPLSPDFLNVFGFRSKRILHFSLDFPLWIFTQLNQVKIYNQENGYNLCQSRRSISRIVFFSCYNALKPNAMGT